MAWSLLHDQGPESEDAVTANFHIGPAPLRGAVSYSRQGARRPASGRSANAPLAWHDAARDEPARELLANTLCSACDLIGAERGFVLVLREETTLEVACTRGLPSQELLDLLFGVAARALHSALAKSSKGLGDAEGVLLSETGTIPEPCAPAVVSLPLDLGSRQRGALCLLRAAEPRTLSELDFEILAALAGQAELALASASQRRALSRLEASLQAVASAPTSTR